MLDFDARARALERLIEGLESQAFLDELAHSLRGAPPAERWAVMRALCAVCERFVTPVEPEPLSPEIIAILEALQQSA